MKSLVAPLATLALLAPAAAQAGTYVGVGIGTGASTDGGLSSLQSDGKHSGRLVLGDRFGILSIEGGLGYFGLSHAGNDWTGISLGVAGKASVPILPVLDGYVRLGLEENRLSASTASSSVDLSGSGWTGGLGVEYKLAVVSFWAEVSKHTMSFDNHAYDGAATMFTIGANIGF